MLNRDHLIEPTGMLNAAPVPPVASKRDIGFDTIDGIDLDADLGFALRGKSYNALVNGALPLFGLVIRLRKLGHYDDVEKLYGTVRDQIAALDEEIHGLGYDGATQLAFRYSLCTFIDEAVMSTPWGSHSIWAARSLLSNFHNETWGGEKFFTVLSRMLMDPRKYRDVLEFKYLCLCLGFRGRYGLQHNQSEALQALIAKLHGTLRGLRGDAPDTLTEARNHVASRRYLMGWSWPWWTPWLSALAVLALVYTLYAVSLHSTADEVLHSLDTMLRR
ncbi:type IVB secretion system protein IcmH/DotU [Paraburkholderia tropica]|uniref:type IVB secretion system protein IcmH/DotU n=1 Tax=Paraburkholderia tropica TaxID=92647 RepID=UPI001590438F|nr:type IVB secretion system protein IcmH/DotU [Paraburkholderia tropica]